MSQKVVTSYIDCPERISFRCHQTSHLAPSWFEDALSVDKLRNTFDGALRTLCPKGKLGEVYIRTVKDPTKLHDVYFYLSGHNNYHLGLSEKEIPDWKSLNKMNPGKYTYYQDERYFLAVKKLYEDRGKEYYLLCLTKKKECSGKMRAQQD